MVNHILKNDSKILQGIMGKLNELERFNRLFAQYLGAEAAKHCQVAKLEKNCLFVIVDNGNWATQLRFHIPDLMVQLRKHPGLESLSGIICKTRPNLTVVKASKSRARIVASLSEETAASVLETAKLIKDKRLKEILEKIAKK